MRMLLGLVVLLCGAPSVDAAEPAAWTWTWCSEDGEKVIQVTGARGENFYWIKIDGEKAIRVTEDEIDGASGVMPGSRPHYGEDGHSDGFRYQGHVFRSCD